MSAEKNGCLECVCDSVCGAWNGLCTECRTQSKAALTKIEQNPSFNLTSKMDYPLNFSVVFQEPECNVDGSIGGGKNIVTVKLSKNCNINSFSISAIPPTPGTGNCQCYKRGECPCVGCSISGLNIKNSFPTFCLNPDSTNNCNIALNCES